MKRMCAFEALLKKEDAISHLDPAIQRVVAPVNWYYCDYPRECVVNSLAQPSKKSARPSSRLYFGFVVLVKCPVNDSEPR